MLFVVHVLCILLYSVATTAVLQGKTKIPFPIYYEAERPPTAGVPEGVIEREQVSKERRRRRRRRRRGGRKEGRGRGGREGERGGGGGGGGVKDAM